MAHYTPLRIAPRERVNVCRAGGGSFWGFRRSYIGERRRICHLICSSELGAAKCLSNAPLPECRWLSPDANGGHCQSPRPALTKSVRASFTFTSHRACASSLSAARMHHKDRRRCRRVGCSGTRRAPDAGRSAITAERRPLPLLAWMQFSRRFPGCRTGHRRFHRDKHERPTLCSLHPSFRDERTSPHIGAKSVISPTPEVTRRSARRPCRRSCSSRWRTRLQRWRRRTSRSPISSRRTRW
jgi:hypothetical protein